MLTEVVVDWEACSGPCGRTAALPWPLPPFVDRGISIASDLGGSIAEGHLRFAMPRDAFLEATRVFVALRR